MTSPLVHIGYHKTGTSWLLHKFFAEPSTGFRPLDKASRTAPVHALIRARPLDFDAAASRAEFAPFFADTEAAGLLPVVCVPRLSGHPFSGGYDSKLIADRLREVIPEARILISIREQRSMIVSTYKQYVRAGGICTLEHFLEPSAEEGWRVPAFDYRHFEYHRLIAHYQELYGKESVLVLPYEHLVADGREFVATIGRFAGRAIPGDVLDGLPYTKRSQVSKSAISITVSRPLNRLGPRSDLNPAPLLESDRIVALTRPLRRKSKLFNSPRWSTLAGRSERGLRRAVAEAVGERYVESNRTTAELIAVDLAAHGWLV